MAAGAAAGKVAHLTLEERLDQAGRYQRGETGQRPGCTGNPFRPR